MVIRLVEASWFQWYPPLSSVCVCVCMCELMFLRVSLYQDLPQGDEAQAVSNNLFSTLISKATELAERWV